MNDFFVDMTGVRLRRGGRDILDGIDWRMGRGEHWAVIGANGSGKTTLLKIAGGILFPTAGEVTVLGGRFGSCDLQKLRQLVGWVGPAIQQRMPPGDSAWDVVASGLRATFGKVYDCGAEYRPRVDECLRQVGLSGRGMAEFGVLSQGEQQRVLFARSLVAAPRMLILDEACAGLDLPSREKFLAVVEGVMRRGEGGVVMVTHHIEEIPAAMTHALVLRSGRVLAAGEKRDVLRSEVLSAAFGLPVKVDFAGGRFWARLD